MSFKIFIELQSEAKILANLGKELKSIGFPELESGEFQAEYEEWAEDMSNWIQVTAARAEDIESYAFPIPQVADMREHVKYTEDAYLSAMDVYRFIDGLPVAVPSHLTVELGGLLFDVQTTLINLKNLLRQIKSGAFYVLGYGEVEVIRRYGSTVKLELTELADQPGLRGLKATLPRLWAKFDAAVKEAETALYGSRAVYVPEKHWATVKKAWDVFMRDFQSGLEDLAAHAADSTAKAAVDRMRVTAEKKFLPLMRMLIHKRPAKV